MTEYEVKCPQTWAWYTGYLHDYNESEKKVYITYEDDWKSPEWIDITSVRYKFDKSALSGWRPRENEEVECKARAEEREPYGWWLCKAKKYIGDDSKIDGNTLYNVGFKGWGDQHDEILSLDFIRPKSQSKILSARNMYREEYNVENELKDWVIKHCQNGEILDILMPHKNISSQIIHINYLEQENKLLLIGNKRVLTTMKDIIYCFFERQKTLLRLENKTKQMEENAKLKRQQESKAEKETFNIHPFLSGYVRGKKNQNIDRLKKRYQDKIIKIEPQTKSVYIAAKDKLTLSNAVDQLHIVCKKVIIPYDEMGQIIGAKGKQIQDIKNKSEVIKIISWEKWPAEFDILRWGQLKQYSYPPQNGQASEELNYNEENVPDIIKNATQDNMFADDDIIDLSKGYPLIQSLADQGYEEMEDQNDALVIIGRKSRVDLCVFMIEMTLNHFRAITKTKQNVFLLKTKINEIKGLMPPTAYTPRARRGRQRPYNRQNYDEQKDSSPQQPGNRGNRGNRRGGRGRAGSYQQRGGGRSGRYYQRRQPVNGFSDEHQQNGDQQQQQQYNDHNNQAQKQETAEQDNPNDVTTKKRKRNRNRAKKSKKEGTSQQQQQQTEATT